MWRERAARLLAAAAPRVGDSAGALERGRRSAGDGFPFAWERRFGRCVRGVTLTPALSRQGRGGRRQPGIGFPVSSTGQALFARERRFGRCVRGVTLTPALSRQGRGGRRQPGMGSPYRVRGRLRLHGNDGLGGPCAGSHPHPSPLPSRERGPEAAGDGFPVSSGFRLHGNDGLGVVSGESPSPLPSPVKGEGAGGSRGWVPRIEYGAGSVCTGTTVWALCPGIHPHPIPLPSRERGPEAAGDGFPVSSTGQAPFAGTTVWALCPGSHPHPMPSPVKGEGAGGSRGWVPRIEYGAGSVCTGTTVWALCPGSHPHPCPLPSRERGPEAAGNDGLGVVSGESPSPLPSPVEGEGAGGSRGWVPVCTGTTMWRTGTAVGWSRLVRRPGCPGLAG